MDNVFLAKEKKMKIKTLLTILVLGIFAVPFLALAGDYIIGDGDVLDVSVWGVKDLNVSVKVRPDGKITIPGLGDVKATGYTPQELQKKLGVSIKELVKNPIVTVTVREITNSKVYVFGEGVKSGVFDLTRRTTLLQLLCLVGDLRAANLRKAYVLRNGKKIKENFHRLFIGGDTSEDILIETNDSVYIPLFTEKSVYVLGAVNTPKFIEYREGMTVMEAILEAGGFTKFAKQNDTTILRREGNKERIIAVKAKDLWNDGDMSQNVKLQPSDYVIVKEGMF
jgi:polysaccharide export outer membrane protein